MEHYLESEITCPYCGWKDRDSWESGDSGTMDCGNCDKQFTFERNVDVTYTTYRDEEDCEHEDQDRYCDHCGISLISGDK